jgi:hypothetical protein
MCRPLEVIPALLMRTSSRPCLADTSSKAFEIEASSSMSTWIADKMLWELGNCVLASCTASSAFWMDRPPRRMVYVFGEPTKALITSKPMPVFAPVMRIIGTLLIVKVFY